MDAANERMAGMSQEEWNDAKALEAAILDQLAAAKETGDPTGEAARKLCAMHARWLQMHWGEGTYSPAAHAALAEGYVADPRFTAYYDGSAGEGATAFLRDARPHRHTVQEHAFPRRRRIQAALHSGAGGAGRDADVNP